MKKYVLLLPILLLLLTSCNKNVSTLFHELKQYPHTEYVSLSFPFINLIKLAVSDKESSQIIKKVKSIKVLNMEKCNEESKERFKKKTSALTQNGYETLLKVNDEGENVSVLSKIQKEKIKEVLIIVTDENECSLIQIKANLQMEDINRLINNDMKKLTNKKKKHDDSKRV